MRGLTGRGWKSFVFSHKLLAGLLPDFKSGLEGDRWKHKVGLCAAGLPYFQLVL